MFNFFKKKKPKHTQPSKKPEPTIGEIEISYEMARDAIRSIDGILFRYTYWLEKIGKDQSEDEKAYIEWIKKRQRELWQEERDVEGYSFNNKALYDAISDFYWKLDREYTQWWKEKFPDAEHIGEEIAKHGLPDKFVTSKMDYSAFDNVKKGENGGD